MNRFQKLIIILAGLAAVSVVAVAGLFAALIGVLVLPFIRNVKSPIQKEEPKPPIENAIDAEFTRIDKKE